MPLKIVGIVSVSYRIEKAGIAHRYLLLFLKFKNESHKLIFMHVNFFQRDSVSKCIQCIEINIKINIVSEITKTFCTKSGSKFINIESGLRNLKYCDTL